MKFVTSIYDFEAHKISTIETVRYSALGMAGLILLGIHYEFLPNHAILLFLAVVSGITFALLGFASLLSKEKHSKKLRGYIEITEEYLKWNQHKILWDEIERFSISYDDHKNRYLIESDAGFNNARSTGLNNIIEITLKNSTEFKSNLLIESKESGIKLNKMLWHVVKHNQISYENAKRMVRPKNYKEHQELKEYCK